MEKNIQGTSKAAPERNELSPVEEVSNTMGSQTDQSNGNTEGVSKARSEITENIVRSAELAEKNGESSLAGILLTVVGVIETNTDKHFARVCSKYIDAVKKAMKTQTDPRKIN